MSYHHLRALVWKNYQLMKYHYGFHILQLFIPLLLLYLIASNCAVASIERNKKREETKKVTDTNDDDESSSSIDWTVGYAPANSATDEFMKGIIKDWGDKLKSFANESELENFVGNFTNIKVLGIYFQNLKSQPMPYKFSYILREKHHTALNEHSFHFIEGQVLLNEHFLKYVQTKSKNSIVKREFREYGGKLQVEQFSDWQSDSQISSFILAIFINFAFAILIISIPFIGDVLDERNDGVKELMKITGAKEWKLWLCWFLYMAPINLISFTILVLVARRCEIFFQIPLLVILLYMYLYFMANASLCILFTSLFQNSTVASLLYFFHYLGAVFVHTYVLPRSIFVACLIPVNALHLGIVQIQFIEKNGITFGWHAFTNPQNKDVEVSLLFLLFMFILDTFLYVFLAYYVINVKPGKYGVRKSPLFLFEGLAELYSTKKIVQSPSAAKPDSRVNPKYFETPPTHLVKTIQIVDLHKHYKSTYAVRGVNLTTYQGEITALLGHNGAGKTTTMSILTGMTSPSSGSIYYKKMNVLQNMVEFRHHLGFCSQDSRLFPYLTVMEHLLFFGQMKRLSKVQAILEAENYLRIMNMSLERQYVPKQLSGGMKRKLSLCIAMMGKAEVLILDEPTSGMDTESRRSFWDTLMNLRKGRTMILSTHYMEEADALGDRIAIMDHGVIVCHGTSMFLKKVYDIGYELTVSKSIDNSTDITNLVQSALPNASVISNNRQEIVYKLPFTETQKFPVLFQTLESALVRLSIQHLGMTAALMEQVFFIAGGAAGRGATSQKPITQYAKHGVIVGFMLFLQQLWTIFKKKCLFTIRDGNNIFYRVVLPTILSCLIIWSDYKEIDLFEKPVHLSLSIYSDKKVLYQEKGPNVPPKMAEHMEKYVTETNNVFVKVNDSVDIKQVLASVAHEKPNNYRDEYLLAFIVGLDKPKIMYQDPAYAGSHNLPVAIDTYYNVLLRTVNSQYSIEMSSHPVLVKPTAGQDTKLVESQLKAGCPSFQLGLLAIIYVLLIFGMFTVELHGYFLDFATMERVDGFYHVQMMSRLSPFLYWMGTMLFDLIFFYICIGIRILLIYIIGNADYLNEFNETFLVFLFIFMLYSIGGLLMVYTSSFFISYKEKSFIFFMTNTITFVLSLIQILIQTHAPHLIGDTFVRILTIVTLIITLIAPMCTFYFMLHSFIFIFHKNTQCQHCVKTFKSICEAQQKKFSYIDFSSMEPLSYQSFFLTLEPLTIVMLGQIVAYSIILILINTEIPGRLYNSFKNSIFGTESIREDEGDNDVLVERSKVREFNELAPKDAASISLLVNGIRKNYIRWLSSFTAVSDVSFMVERGKCFGLLGVNGAGKTTTFRILTAELIPTLGDASIDGVKMSENRREYLSAAGYCSQTNCFIEQLTAVEMLNLIVCLRGVQAQDTRALVDRWISISGLEEYKNRRCGDYSGGNKRKLCSAMALIGDPKVVFLDEPTSGVDPMARRNLHNVMANSRTLGQTLVLTSHSMEECEAICDRLTIMVSGVMKCIGSVQRLKKLYAQGFSASFKVFDSAAAEGKIPDLQREIQKTFAPSPITLKDSHSGLLFYQISDTSLPWSVLFQKMESIKQRYPDLLEDYVLTDTSLEEVFISFAKEGK